MGATKLMSLSLLSPMAKILEEASLVSPLRMPPTEMYLNRTLANLIHGSMPMPAARLRHSLSPGALDWGRVVVGDGSLENRYFVLAIKTTQEKPGFRSTVA